MKWIETTGGPFIVLPLVELENWNGVEGDYQRACEVVDYVGLIEFRGAIGMVLGEEPMRTTISNTTNITTYIIRWCFAPNEKTVEDEIHQIENLKFEKPDLLISVNSPLVVFDSSLAGNSVTESETLNLGVSPGRYEVSTCLHKPDSQVFLVIHRLQKLK